MKKQLIHIHGGDSFSDRADFLWYLQTCPVWDLPTTTQGTSWKKNLPTDLGPEYEVFMPSMPNKQNAQYDEWKIWFERYFSYLTGEVVMVGHSLGGMFLAKYLSECTEKLPFTVKTVYLLAAPGGEYTVTPAEGDCLSFQFSGTVAARLTETVPHVEIWHSTDDGIVPVTEAAWYKNHVPGAKIRIFTDKNHFLLPEFPELIEAITAL